MVDILKKALSGDPEDEFKDPVLVDMSVNITGSRIDDASGYDLDEDIINWYRAESDTNSDPKLLLVDYELTNESDKAGRCCFLGYYTYSKDMEFCCNEPHYMENKDNGGKDSYMFDFEPHQTKKITLGYLVSEEYTHDGFYVFVPTDQSASGYELTADNVENGKVKVMTVKE